MTDPLTPQPAAASVPGGERRETCSAHSPHAIEDYRLAPYGEGPLAHEWADKPHRVLFSLVHRADKTERINGNLVDALRAIAAGHCSCQSNTDPEWHSATCRKAIADNALREAGEL